MIWTVVAWVACGLLVTAAVITVAILIRARRLSRWVGAFACDWRGIDDQIWSTGVAVYGVDRLDWYRLYSMSPYPRRTWIRQSLDASGQRISLPGSDADVVEVKSRYEGQEFYLALDRSSLAGLTSWLEASPPRRADYEID